MTLSAVATTSPAATAPMPRSAPATAGTLESWPYSAASTSTMSSGASSSPASAASAPRRPKKRSPIISARLTMLGPGSTWPSDSVSTNCSR
jgi:hypothetical protein